MAKGETQCISGLVQLVGNIRSNFLVLKKRHYKLVIIIYMFIIYTNTRA